jgi:hypothetical protein
MMESAEQHAVGGQTYLRQAEDGRWHGGAAPFGYRMDNSSLVVVPEHAMLVRRAADRVLAGDSLYRVVRDWNEAGVPSAKGTKWATTALRQVLTNPAVTGVRTYRPILDDGSVSKETVLTTEGVWEPILEREVFEKVGRVIDARGAAYRVEGRGRTRLYPFSGLIRCGRCGIVMRKQAGFYVCCLPERGTCSRRINFEQTNTIILAALLEAYSAPSILDRLTGTTALSEEAKHLQKQLATDRAALSRLDDDHYDGLVDRATWLRQRARIHDRLTRNQAVIEQTTPMLPTAVFDLDSVASEWSEHTPAWQNQAARLLLDWVVIHAHPKKMGSTTNRRKGESVDEHAVRHAGLRGEIMTRRVELVWAR